MENHVEQQKTINGDRTLQRELRPIRDWASVRRFVGARNPAERFTRLVGASDGYAMGVVLLLGGVTMVFLPLIAACR
jgi:hypothetical protein